MLPTRLRAGGCGTRLARMCGDAPATLMPWSALVLSAPQRGDAPPAEDGTVLYLESAPACPACAGTSVPSPPTGRFDARRSAAARNNGERRSAPAFVHQLSVSPCDGAFPVDVLAARRVLGKRSADPTFPWMSRLKLDGRLVDRRFCGCRMVIRRVLAARASALAGCYGGERWKSGTGLCRRVSRRHWRCARWRGATGFRPASCRGDIADVPESIRRSAAPTSEKCSTAWCLIAPGGMLSDGQSNGATRRRGHGGLAGHVGGLPDPPHHWPPRPPHCSTP